MSYTNIFSNVFRGPVAAMPQGVSRYEATMSRDDGTNRRGPPVRTRTPPSDVQRSLYGQSYSQNEKVMSALRGDDSSSYYQTPQHYQHHGGGSSRLLHPPTVGGDDYNSPPPPPPPDPPQSPTSPPWGPKPTPTRNNVRSPVQRTRTPSPQRRINATASDVYAELRRRNVSPTRNVHSIESRPAKVVTQPRSQSNAKRHGLPSYATSHTDGHGRKHYVIPDAPAQDSRIGGRQLHAAPTPTPQSARHAGPASAAVAAKEMTQRRMYSTTVPMDQRPAWRPPVEPAQSRVQQQSQRPNNAPMHNGGRSNAVNADGTFAAPPPLPPKITTATFDLREKLHTVTDRIAALTDQLTGLSKLHWELQVEADSLRREVVDATQERDHVKAQFERMCAEMKESLVGLQAAAFEKQSQVAAAKSENARLLEECRLRQIGAFPGAATSHAMQRMMS